MGPERRRSPLESWKLGMASSGPETGDAVGRHRIPTRLHTRRSTLAQAAAGAALPTHSLLKGGWEARRLGLMSEVGV